MELEPHPVHVFKMLCLDGSLEEAKRMLTICRSGSRITKDILFSNYINLPIKTFINGHIDVFD